VQYHFYRLRNCGLLDIINEALVNASRLVAGREAQPTVAIINSQLVKTTENGGISGFDAGKKVKCKTTIKTLDRGGKIRQLLKRRDQRLSS
jgi:hypothetical protein